MASLKQISSALISVYSKEGLDRIVKKLNELGVTLYSTGGTYSFIEGLGIQVSADPFAPVGGCIAAEGAVFNRDAAGKRHG